MRLIDADALLEVLNDKNVTTFSALIEEQRTVAFYVYCKVVDAIEKMPTIEAEPVRHGHWNAWTATHWTKKYDDNGDPIYKEHTYYQCSECRRRTVIKSAYCPACGCRMDEVSE